MYLKLFKDLTIYRFGWGSCIAPNCSWLCISEVHFSNKHGIFMPCTLEVAML